MQTEIVQLRDGRMRKGNSISYRISLIGRMQRTRFDARAMADDGVPISAVSAIRSWNSTARSD